VSLEALTDLMRHAGRGNYAIGYFESWNIESLQGVIDAAEATRSPVILGFNGDFLTRQNRLAGERVEWYGQLGKTAAESTAVPCGLIFNECPLDASVVRAMECGFNIVSMADPAADYSDYVRRVRQMTALAHARGVGIEAEVGELPGGVSGVVDDGGNLTSPEEAARFVEDTGVDLLAVSVGNVHIMVKGREALDLDRLAAVHSRVSVPLVLHGGTGISPETLRGAISLGVRKVNYGTCLKQPHLQAVRDAMRVTQDDPHRLLGIGGREDVMVAGRLAVRQAVLERIAQLGSAGRA